MNTTEAAAETRTIQGPFYSKSTGQVHPTAEMTFEQYMKHVDRAVYRRGCVSVYDLPDYDYLSAWEDGIPPHEAAIEHLENEGWDAFTEGFEAE